MHVELNQLLTSWHIRPFITLLILTLSYWHLRGRLRTTTPDIVIRPWLFRTSMIVLIVALMSPIDTFAPHFFFMRVAQHILLVSLFPATLMGSNGLEAIYYGLPHSMRNRLDSQAASHHDLLKMMTPKGVCWFLFIAAAWLWYDQALLDLTLRYPRLRVLELSTICLAALLHWWHVTAAFPRLHPPLPTFAHIGYTWAGMLPLKLPGLFFLFATAPFYNYPTATFLGIEMDALVSQQWGGIAVWLVGGIVYSSTAGKFFMAWLSVEADKPPQPMSLWDNDETLRAPGL